MQICEYEKCTGCFACRNICPHNAIDVVKTQYGECIPKIDDDKCIDCGLCKKICPSNQEISLIKPETAYAAWSKNEEDTKKSSSGGVAAVFSRYVLENGGVVYGASCEDKKTKHIRIDSINEIDKLRGSKYVQSDIGFIYKDVKEQLLKDKLVLFTGTPCQIAGLKSYLVKDYKNLITADLICHGTPPHTYLEEHLNSKCESWDAYSFRGKYDFQIAAYNNGEVTFIKDSDRDEYFLSFLDGLTYRSSCYSCKYARPERVSDITIGDFWGLDRTTMKNQYNGRISLVLPNTQKGIEFYKGVEKMFFSEERTVGEAMNETQGNLLHPSFIHPDREMFLELYTKVGYDRAVKKTSLWKKKIKEERVKRLKRTFLVRGLRKLKRIIFD